MSSGSKALPISTAFLLNDKGQKETASSGKKQEIITNQKFQTFRPLFTFCSMM